MPVLTCLILITSLFVIAPAAGIGLLQ